MDIVEDFIRGTDAPFLAFAPSDLLNTVKNPKLFSGHVRELFKRYQRGDDLRPASMAEVAVALHQMSLIAPLEQNHAAAYGRAFVIALAITKERELCIFPEKWAGGAGEVLNTLSRKFRCDWRKT